MGCCHALIHRTTPSVCGENKENETIIQNLFNKVSCWVGAGRRTEADQPRVVACYRGGSERKYEGGGGGSRLLPESCRLCFGPL